MPFQSLSNYFVEINTKDQELFEKELNRLIKNEDQSEVWKLSHNLMTEEVFSKSDLERITFAMPNCTNLDDFKILLNGILKENEYNFTSNEITVVKPIELIATVTKEKYLIKNLSDSAFDDDDFEIDQIDLETDPNYTGYLKESGTIWFSWDYENPISPELNFVNASGICSKDVIFNKLALSQGYLFDELRIFLFPIESLNLYRATVKEAGFNSGFVCCSSSEYHGYTYPWDISNDYYSEVEHVDFGCPEAICGYDGIKLEMSTRNIKIA